MNIVYHLTDNYARISGTSIVSVFENNKDAEEINVYLIENGFTKDTKKKFTELANHYGRNIYFIPMPDLNGPEYDLSLVSIKKRWLFDSYSRLFLDRLLPENVDRVLYLDGDVIVKDSLKKLWGMDLDDKCCAAVLDCVSKPYYKLFGIDEKNAYCNSGVILINLNRWRKYHISEKIKRNIQKNNGYVFFMEQTVFNVVLQNETVHLPFKYNVSSLVRVLPYEDLMKLRHPLHFYSEQEVNESQNHPVILHMTGFFYVINRAWNEVTNHPDKATFVEYSKKLNKYGWNDPILQKDKRSTRTKIKDFIIHSIPRSFMIYLVSVLYNHIRVKNIQRISKRIQRKKGKILV